MNEFVLIFRNEVMPEVQFDPEGMVVVSKKWQDWIGGIAAQGKLSARGNRLGTNSKTVKANNVVTNGPYVEIKEMISGYTILKADSIQEAVEIAKGCPILEVGGNVEVRDIVLMNL